MEKKLFGIQHFFSLFLSLKIVVGVEIAILAEAFTIHFPVRVLAFVGHHIASVYMITVITHSLGIMRQMRVRTICYLSFLLEGKRRKYIGNFYRFIYNFFASHFFTGLIFLDFHISLSPSLILYLNDIFGNF